MRWSYQFERSLFCSVARAPESGAGSGCNLHPTIATATDNRSSIDPTSEELQRSGTRTQSWAPNLSRRDACRYLEQVHGLKFQPSTLAKWWSVSSHGPPAFLNGRFPVYPTVELDAWARRRLGELRTSTSDDRHARARSATAKHRSERAA